MRAAVGAVEGAVGASGVEPMVAAGSSELQQKYVFADSLMNIVSGADMRAVMHPLSGAVGAEPGRAGDDGTPGRGQKA